MLFLYKLKYDYTKTRLAKNPVLHHFVETEQWIDYLHRLTCIE